MALKKNSYRWNGVALISRDSGDPVALNMQSVIDAGFTGYGKSLVAAAILFEETNSIPMVTEWAELFCQEVVIPWQSRPMPLTSAIIEEWVDEQKVVSGRPCD